MADPSDELHELEQRLQERGIEASALAPDSGGTIAPPSDATASVAEHPTPTELPLLGAPEVSIGRTIAEGGMGVVRRAVQLPLQREVVVKCARKDGERERSVAALLREARVTGILEHPNIIPIHTLGRDEDGDPIFAMKRVDGVPLSTLVRDPEHPAGSRDGRDPLEFQIGVLMQVCNAVHFAHSKGIIHRDLKPSNVMIGEFGEVYVLDWGVAVTTRDELSRILRHVRDVNEVAGTPQFMAPELAIGDGASIDARTDVYLIGAMLYQCLTGAPPHHGKNVMATLLHAFRSRPPSFDDKVPAELARICSRAMAADPAQRYPSAEELRRALQGFLEHRQSAALGQQAALRLDALGELLEAAGPQSPVDPARVHTLFSECRFGYRQALRTWPDNPDARRGLERALALMAGHHIDREEHQQAALLLGEMSDPPAELRVRLDGLAATLRAREAQVEQLRHMEREMDLDVGRRVRTTIVLVIAFVYFCLPLLAGVGHRRGWFDADLLVVTSIALSFVVLGLVGIRLGRETLLRTEVNRRIVRAMRVLSAAMIALPLGCLWIGLDGHTLQTMLLLTYALFIGGLAATVDPRIIWAGAIYLTGFLAAAAFRWMVFEVTAVATILATSQIAYVWWPRAPAPGGDGTASS